MTSRAELLETRFLANMGRITGMVRLIHSHDALKPKGVFGSEGVRADMLRAIVVFLHATFEVVLRSHLRKPDERLCFYSRADLDKALRRSNIDATPFKPLYNPLTQMAKRRLRIVHDADLSKRTDAVPEGWGVVDDWQLPMWLMAVPAFYYQMRVSVGVASIVERAAISKIRKAMSIHVDFGKQLVAFPKILPELRIKAMQNMVTTLADVAATLKVDVSEFE